MREPSLLYVRWRDAFSSHEEIDPGEWQSEMVVETLGFLVDEDAGYLHIAQEIVHVLGGDRLRCVTHVPTECVIARLPLDQTRKVALHEVAQGQDHPTAG